MNYLFGGDDLPNPLKKDIEDCVAMFDSGKISEATAKLKETFKKNENLKLTPDKVSRLSKIILSSTSKELYWIIAIHFLVFVKNADFALTMPHLERIGHYDPVEFEELVDTYTINFSEDAEFLFSLLSKLREQRVYVEDTPVYVVQPPFFLIILNLLQDSMNRNGMTSKPFKWREHDLVSCKFEWFENNKIFKQKIKNSGKGCFVLSSSLENQSNTHSNLIDGESFDHLFDDLVITSESRKIAESSPQRRRSSLLGSISMSRRSIDKNDGKLLQNEFEGSNQKRRSSLLDRFSMSRRSMDKNDGKMRNDKAQDTTASAPPLAPRPQMNHSHSDTSRVGSPTATATTTASSSTTDLVTSQSNSKETPPTTNSDHSEKVEKKYPIFNPYENRSSSAIQTDHEAIKALSPSSDVHYPEMKKSLYHDENDDKSIDSLIGSSLSNNFGKNDGFDNRSSIYQTDSQNFDFTPKLRAESRHKIVEVNQQTRKFQDHEISKLLELTSRNLKQRQYIQGERSSWISALNKMIVMCINDPIARAQYFLSVEHILKSYPNKPDTAKSKANILSSALMASPSIENIFIEADSPVIFEAVQYLNSPYISYKNLSTNAWKFAITKYRHLQRGKETKFNKYSRKSLLEIQIDPVKLFDCRENPLSALIPIEIAFEMKSWTHVASASQIDIRYLPKEGEKIFESRIRNLVFANKPKSSQDWKHCLSLFCSNSFHATFQAKVMVSAFCMIDIVDLLELISMIEFIEIQSKFPDIHAIIYENGQRSIRPGDQDGHVPLWFIEYMKKMRIDSKYGKIPDPLKVIIQRLIEYFNMILDGSATISGVNAWANNVSFWIDINRAIGQKTSERVFEKALEIYRINYFESKELLQALKESRDYFEDVDKYECIDPWDVREDADVLKQSLSDLDTLKSKLGFVKSFEEDFKSFVFLVKSKSQLLKGALRMQNITERTTHALHVRKALIFLKSMLGNSAEKGFRLSNLNIIHNLLKELSKGSIDREMTLIEHHFEGSNSRIKGQGLMSAAIDLSMCKKFVVDIIKFLDSIANGALKLDEKVASTKIKVGADNLREWNNRHMDPLLNEAEGVLQEFFKYLPTLNVQMITIFPLLLESDYLVEFIFNRFGKNDEDFQRTITMLRGNFQDDERATSILSSLQISRDILSNIRVDFMDNKQISRLSVESLCDSIKKYHSRDPDFSNLRNSIRHVDDAKSYLDQLKNDDTQSVIIMIWSQAGRCTVLHSGGQEADINDILQRVNFALSSSKPPIASNDDDSRMKSLNLKYELLKTCREGHHTWIQLSQTSFPAPSDKCVLYHAPGYQPDRKPEVLLADAPDDIKKNISEKERYSRKWYMLSNLSLNAYTDARNSTSLKLDDIIWKAILECMKPKTKQQLQDFINIKKLEKLENKSGIGILLSCLSDIESGLMQVEITNSKNIVNELNEIKLSWATSLGNNCRIAPRLFLLSNNQLKFILSNDLKAIGSSIRHFGLVCDISIEDQINRKMIPEEVSRLFSNGQPAQPLNVENPQKIINLGYAEGENITSLLLKTLIEAGSVVTTANVFWCNGNHTSADVENFLHRPGALPDSAFIVLKPDRLSLSSRRHLMHLLSGNELKGGMVHLLFSDHEVEAAISKALKCDKAENVKILPPIGRSILTLYEFTPIMNNRQQDIVCVHGSIGDGKTLWINDQMKNIKGSIPLRICIHEKFTSDYCSKMIINHIRKNKIEQSLVLHFDIADGESITNSILFYWKVMRDHEYLNRLTVRPLEELEKFVFQFFILGFLVDDTTGEVMTLPASAKVHGYFELPSIHILNNHLHLVRSLGAINCPNTKGRTINISDKAIRLPYTPQDRDDDFAGYCLNLIATKNINGKTIYEGVQKWEKSLIENKSHMDGALNLTTINNLIESKMPNWDRRSQRNVCVLLATRMSLLGRFGKFHSSAQENELAQPEEANAMIIQRAPLILESALRKFQPGIMQDERQFEQVVLGGDEKNGASCEILQLRSPSDVPIIDPYELKEIPNGTIKQKNGKMNQKNFLSQLSPSELRASIAPVLGLGAWSHTIVEELQRQKYALTPDFGLKLLTQCEYRDARSPIIYSGGTGVGKSEGAKLQSQLALAEGYFDIAQIARETILGIFMKRSNSEINEFVNKIGGPPIFEKLCVGFQDANIKLGSVDLWEVMICREKIFPNKDAACILLIPKTVSGCRPLKLNSKDMIEATCNDKSVSISIHHNGNNAFIIKAKSTKEGQFDISVKISGKSAKSCRVISSMNAPTSTEDPTEYLHGSKVIFSDITEGLSNSVESMPNTSEGEISLIKQECAKLLKKWLRRWILENALVPSVRSKFSALQRLEMIDLDNSKECLKELGKFGENLRRPDLTFKICIHPSTTIDQLKKLVGRAVYRLAHMLEWLYSKKGGDHSMGQLRRVAVVFFDELNTSSFPGLMKQLILDRVLDNMSLVELGKEEQKRIETLVVSGKYSDPDLSEDSFGPNGFKITNDIFYSLAADGILFIGAINPLKKENEVVSENIDSLSQLKDDAVFNVTELPEALKRAVREFGDQDDIAMRDVVLNILTNINYMTEIERLDCCRLIMLSHRLITSYRKGTNPDGTFERYDGNRVKAIQEMENTHSSIRNIWRTVKITNFFIDHPKLIYLKAEFKDGVVDEALLNERATLPDGIEIRRRAFLTALGSAYYLQLLKIEDSNIDLRDDFGSRIDNSFVFKSWGQIERGAIPPAVLRGISFKETMERSIYSTFEHARPLLSKEHAETTVLKEHIFSILVCTQLKIPVLIVGPPGCSKTLAYQLVASGFKTIYSIDEKFPGCNFKCLEESVYQCSELSTAQEIEIILKNAVDYTGKRDRTHPAVLLDEASLAPRALKAIHEPFDQANVACVVLSNLQLDAAKTNRCLYLRRKGFGDEFEDLKLLALSSTKITEKQDDMDNLRSIAVLEGICRAYLKLVEDESPFKSTFHLRHFLYCVRYLAPFDKTLNTSPQRIAEAISRNFGGLDQQQFEDKIAKIFFEEIRKSLEEKGVREKAKEYTYPLKSWSYDAVGSIEESIKGSRDDCGKEGFDPNIHAPRNVMLVVRGDGLGLLDMVIDKEVLNNTKLITISSFLGDDDNIGREKAISDVAREMTEGNIIRLYNGEKGRVFSAFYDAFNMRFAKAGAVWYVTVTAGSRSMSRQYDPKFRAIVIIDQVEYDRMRSEKSKMLPFLSRFEAYNVSPSSILQSSIGISRLRNNHDPTQDHKKWIQSAVNRTFELLVQGSGCFVGVGGIGQDALDTAITLILTSSTISSENVGKNEAREMVKAANKKLLQTARPDALCLRTRVKWLPDDMIKSYLLEQEHFSLKRYLHSTNEKLSFILMRSTIELTNAAILKAICPAYFEIIELDKCDRASTFELKLQEIFRSKPRMVLITVNFSTVSYDQLYHVHRIIETNKLLAEKSSISIIAYLSSDRFELGQVPYAKFTLGWTTLFIDAVGQNNPTERTENLDQALKYSFRIQDGIQDSINIAIDGDFVPELKSACRRIKVTKSLSLMDTGVRQNELIIPDKLKEKNIFVVAVYNESNNSRLVKGRNDNFFLSPKSSAHQLFVKCCQKVLGKLPENKHIEIITERAAMSTIGGNDGEPFEKTATEAKQVFRNDSVCSLLAAILNDGGLVSFLNAAGDDKSLLDGKAFDEKDPLVQMTLLGSLLIKESNSRFHQVGVLPRGFIPKTPFYSLILQRIQVYIKRNKFEALYIEKNDKILHEIILVMEAHKIAYHNFLDDLIRSLCEIQDSSKLELSIARKCLNIELTRINSANTENVNTICRMITLVLQKQDIIQYCRKLMWNTSPLQEFPDKVDEIVANIEKSNDNSLFEDLFDEIYRVLSILFQNNSPAEMIRILRSIRILTTICRTDSESNEQVKRLCSKEGSLLLPILCAYTAYCFASTELSEESLVKFIRAFKPKEGSNDPLLKQFGVSLKDVLKDLSVFWKSIEGISLILLEYDKSFFNPKNNCEQLFVLIQSSSWTTKGKLSGNRECYIIRTIYANIKGSADLRNQFSRSASAALLSLKSKFESPYTREGEYEVRPNLEDSLYWMSYEDENRELCSLEELLNSKIEDPAINIRTLAAKDKVIAQVADHMNNENKWHQYVDSECKGCVCRGITHHKQIAKNYLFSGPKGPVFAKNLLGHLRTDIAEQILRQAPAILDDFGLSCLVEHRIEGKANPDEYKNLLKIPFSRGGNDDPQSINEYKEYKELQETVIGCIIDKRSDKFQILINAADEIKCFRYRAYLIVILYENGLLKRQDISKIFIIDSICRKLLVDKEERKWLEALGGDLSHFQQNPLPEIRYDDLQATYKAAHKALKAKSVSLYCIACEPRGTMTALYLSILATAFGAPKERNHLWQRIFNISQTAKNIGAPMFRDATTLPDIDCSYDLEYAASDIFTKFDDRNLHRCHVGAVAWGCNALACALPTLRNEAIRQCASGLCQFHGDQKTSTGMDPELVRLAANDELSWRNQYLHIRSANFLELLQRNIEAPNVNPGMKSWPKDLSGAFSVNALDLYRQQMCAKPNFLSKFPTLEVLRQYEAAMTQILAEVEINSPKIVAKVKDFGGSESRKNYLIKAQEFVGIIKLQNPYRYGGFDPIKRHLESKLNRGVIEGRQCGHILEYIYHYKGAVESIQAMRKHGAVLFDIYRFCCEKLSGKLYIGNVYSRYSDSTLLVDVLKNFAHDEREKGNKAIADTSLKYANELVGHYNELSKVANIMAAIGCQQTPRPIGELLLAGDALGGVPGAANKSGWIIKTLIDVGKECSKVAQLADDDKALLWKWDEKFGIAHDNGTSNISAAFMNQSGYKIIEFDCFVELHLPKFNNKFDLKIALDGISEINRTIVTASGGALCRNIKWREDDLIYPILWKFPTDDSNDDNDNENSEHIINEEIDNDERARRDRIDMLDNDGTKLARLSGYISKPNDVAMDEIKKIMLPPNEEKKIRKFLESKNNNERVNAYIYCPKLVEACGQCTVQNITEDLSSYINDWPKDIPMKVEFLWSIGRICVEVILSRNSKFSDLDVVLQSGLVKNSGMIRRELLLNIKKSLASEVLQQIKQLSLYLHEVRVLRALAEDPKRSVKTVISEIFPTFKCNSKLLPDIIIGSCLADYLLLLHDIASRLRLRSAKFGTLMKNNDDGNLYNEDPLEPSLDEKNNIGEGNEENLKDLQANFEEADTFKLKVDEMNPGRRDILDIIGANAVPYAEEETPLEDF